MPTIVSFADFLAATRDVKVTPNDQLLNEATKNTYFVAQMLKGKDLAKRFRGGTKLIEKIQGADGGSFGFYSPSDEQSPTQTPTLKTVEVNWGFAKTDYTYTDEEVELNSGDAQAYIDLKASFEQNRAVDLLNGMEEALWAAPNSDTMESVSADPKVAYSFPCFVTRNGGVPSSSNGGIASGSTAWTTLATINPTTETWYKNKFKSYVAATPDDLDAGLIASFDDLVLQVQFETPDGLKKYSENESLQKMQIATSRDGINFFKARLRALNDRMEMLRDPAIPGVQYNGIPLKYVAELDNAGWTTSQPDYYFLNLNFIFPFFHSKWFLKEVMTDGGVRQPTSHTNYQFTWYNNFCRSRRRQGRIYAA